MTAQPGHVQVGGHRIRLVHAPYRLDPVTLAARLTAAGLPIGVPTVALVGGAAGLDESQREACARQFEAELVPVLEQTGAVLVDGGTDSGVMALAGAARRRAHGRGLHIGVVAAGTVRLPGVAEPAGGEVLEPNHTHVVLVPGSTWGDEAPWLSAVAGALSAGAGSVTLLANGGGIAYRDVRHSVADRRRVLVLAGTGRAAQEIAAARAGMPANPHAAEVAASPLVHLVPDAAGALTGALTAALRSELAAPGARLTL